MDSEGTQPYVYMFSVSPTPPSHLGWYIILSRVPCAIQWVFVGYPFKIQSCVYGLPRVPDYLFPWQPRLFSMSLSVLSMSLFVSFLFRFHI